MYEYTHLYEITRVYFSVLRLTRIVSEQLMSLVYDPLAIVLHTSIEFPTGSPKAQVHRASVGEQSWKDQMMYSRLYQGTQVVLYVYGIIIIFGPIYSGQS